MSPNSQSYHKLAIAYILPYAAYVTIASLLSGLDPGINYTIRIGVVGAILIWGWRRYVPLRGPGNWIVSVVAGIIFGLLGILLWIALLFPFVTSGEAAGDNFSFGMRILASTLLVPIFEELLMRVYVFRLVHHWYMERKIKKDNAFNRVFHTKSLNDFKPGDWSFFAIIFSSIIFALGHQVVEWPAAFAYGLLMAFLWVWRKDVLTCVMAHATTNLTLGLYVYLTGSWQYW